MRRRTPRTSSQAGREERYGSTVESVRRGWEVEMKEAVGWASSWIPRGCG